MDLHTLFVGIDVSKLKHDIAILSGQKQPVEKSFVIKNEHSEYHALLKRLQGLQAKYHTACFSIGLEATSDYWKNLYYFLKKQGPQFKVTVINPVQTRSWAKTELRRAKTDPVDAKDIALFMVEKQPLASEYRTPLLDIIKDIDRSIYLIKKQQTMTLIKLRLELCKVAPELEQSCQNIKSKRLLALLGQFLPPKRLQGLQTTPWPVCGMEKELAFTGFIYQNHQDIGAIEYCI